jgi:hypothetical protein
MEAAARPDPSFFLRSGRDATASSRAAIFDVSSGSAFISVTVFSDGVS